MKSIIPLFLVFIAAAFAQENKLKVSVYYETLCGDSKRFIRSQLHPTKQLTDLGKSFDVELVPYGKASTVQISPTSYSFDCQHGKPECEGNKMHACAIKYIKDPNVTLDFVHCSMSSSYPPNSLDECAEANKIDTTEIKKCTEGLEGDELLAANGRKTHGLSPKLYFVPWITYNDEFDEDNLNNSQRKFKTVVCQELKKNGVIGAGC